MKWMKVKACHQVSKDGRFELIRSDGLWTLYMKGEVLGVFSTVRHAKNFATWFEE